MSLLYLLQHSYGGGKSSLLDRVSLPFRGGSSSEDVSRGFLRGFLRALGLSDEIELDEERPRPRGTPCMMRRCVGGGGGGDDELVDCKEVDEELEELEELDGSYDESEMWESEEFGEDSLEDVWAGAGLNRIDS